MNKIIIKDNQVFIEKVNSGIKLDIVEKKDKFDIGKLQIDFLESNEIELECNGSEEIKFDIIFTLQPGINLKVKEYRNQYNIKTRYQFFLNENASLEMDKFYNCDKVKEQDIIYMNGKNSVINYTLSTICKDKQKFNIVVYHKYKDSISNIKTRGVNINDGMLSFGVTGVVYKNVTGCEVNQNNRIINLTKNKCEILPNLLIDEEDVVASHSALVGNFDDEELFYLRSRGISYSDAIKLLIIGFLLNGNDDKKKLKIINSYWR